NLKAAQDKKAAFLEEVEKDEEAIEAAVEAADSVVATTTYVKVNAKGDVNDNSGSGFVVYSTGDSPAVKAAKLSDAQTQLQTNLDNYTAILNTKKADAGKVEGLNAAVDSFNSKVEATKAATKAELEALAKVNASVTNLDTLVGSANK